jgi:type I restriction enzyme S subunit
MNAPKLRFDGFSDSWESYTLESLGEFKNGVNKSKEDFGHGSPFVNLMDIFGKDSLVNKSFELVNVTQKELNTYNLLKGDVIFIRSSVKLDGVGQTAVVLENLDKTVYSGFLIRFREDENRLSLLYKKYCFSNKSFRNQVLSVCTTSANTNINQESLNQLTLNLPTFPEQTKIAKFLTSVDERINQLTQKHALISQYKKGMMQQIFSQQLRFKDDDGKEFGGWEELPANEVFCNCTNKNHDGSLPILAAMQDKGMIYRENSGLDIKAMESSVKAYKVVDKGDFVISLRSFQGGIEYSFLHGICSPAYTILKPKIKIVDAFYRAYLKKDDFIERLNGTVVGIRDGKQISFNAFSTLVLPYPSIPEQTKIANFLTSLDDKINQVQKQLDEVKHYKQGLLQQMFV